MHSSRMLQWPSRGGGVCLGGLSAGGVHLPHHQQNHRTGVKTFRLYLSANSFADGKNKKTDSHRFRHFQIQLLHYQFVGV